jgi:hypothetical protein
VLGELIGIRRFAVNPTDSLQFSPHVGTALRARQEQPLRSPPWHRSQGSGSCGRAFFEAYNRTCLLRGLDSAWMIPRSASSTTFVELRDRLATLNDQTVFEAPLVPMVPSTSLRDRLATLNDQTVVEEPLVPLPSEPCMPTIAITDPYEPMDAESGDSPTVIESDDSVTTEEVIEDTLTMMLELGRAGTTFHPRGVWVCVSV